MEIIVKGISEEEYGLWVSNGSSPLISEINAKDILISRIGFELESIKNFTINMQLLKHIIFLKVHNDKTYDIYREHLITVIKMMILNQSEYEVSIFIVSDKNEDYSKELNSFFNLNTRYQQGISYGQWGAIIKCSAMRFLGFNFTNSILQLKKRVITMTKRLLN